MRRGRECRPRGDTLSLRHRCLRSRARRHLRRTVAARDPGGEPAARPRHRTRRHRDPADAQRAGDILRAVGRRDRGRRQPRQLLPRCLADRRHHEAGRRPGADRGRCLDLPRHLAEGRGHPCGDAGAEGVPRRRRCRHARRRRLRRGLRGPAGRSAGGAEGCPTRHRGGALPHRRDDGTAQARQAHARRPGADGVDQHAGVRSRAGHGAAQSAAAIPCRRLAVRGAGADRQRLDGRDPDGAGRAQSQRRARLLGHRRAQPGRCRRRRADHAGGDHERAARRPRPRLAESLRDRRLDRAGRAHPAHRTRDRCAGDRGLWHDRSALLLDHESAAWRAPHRIGRPAPALHRDPHRRCGARRRDPRRLSHRRDRPRADARPAGHPGLSRSPPRPRRRAGRRLARFRRPRPARCRKAMSG